MPTAVETNITSRRTFLVGMAAATAPIAVIPAVAAAVRPDPFVVAADALEAAVGRLNASTGMTSEERDAFYLSTVLPLGEALRTIPVTSPDAALRVMDLVNTPDCSLSDDAESDVVDALHDYLRTLAGRVA